MSKMYSSIIIKDVKLFKDVNQKERWGILLGGEYDVEIVGQKARVICNSPFVAKKDDTSRLNKLYPCGSCRGGRTPDTFNYELIVNGQKAFFTVEHNIFEKK